MNRREFLKDGLATLGFFALPECRLFAVPPGWRPKGTPNLVFGAVSDTHIRTDWTGKKRYWRFPLKYFKSALEHFKQANADAVMHCGDFAHRGMMMSMQFHADTWREVFGGSGGPAKLFVTGNHDIVGGNYGDFGAKVFKDGDERKKWLFCGDVAGNWERIWGEPYEEVWHKEVKGYHFFGRHWGVDEMKTAELVKKNAEAFGLGDAKKPFFYLQHARSHAPLNRAMGSWKNSFGFFGHAHSSAANWHVIRYEDGAASVQVPACEPRGTGGPGGVGGAVKVPLQGKDAAGATRQGYVVRVYDDMLVIERREFGEGGSLGSDWVLPLNRSDPHPFSEGELKKAIGKAQFRPGAQLAVETSDDAVKVGIPLADGNPDARVFAYDVVVVGEGDAPKLHKASYAAGCNMGVGHETNHGVTTLSVPKSELPSGKKLTLAIRPLTSLGTSGNPIATTFEL